MSFRITFIGAGSIGFTRKLVADLLSIPEFHDVEFAFTDIDREYLAMVTDLCRRDIEHNESAARIVSTTDRREAVTGARYVFCVVRIGGSRRSRAISRFRCVTELINAWGTPCARAA